VALDGSGESLVIEVWTARSGLRTIRRS